MNPTVKFILMLLRATPLAGVADQLEQDLADGRIDLDEVPGLVQAAADAADKVFPGAHLEIALVHDIAVATDNYAKAKAAAGQKLLSEVPAPPAAKPASGKK